MPDPKPFRGVSVRQAIALTNGLVESLLENQDIREPDGELPLIRPTRCHG